MSRFTRDFGKASSWYTKGWALSNNPYSGWSKRAARGFQSHEWDEDASRGSTQTRGVQPESWADAEVEIMDERDKNQSGAATNDATGRKAANAVGNSTGDAANLAMDDENIDFNISGVPNAMVKRSQSISVHNLIQKIESHPQREAIQNDLQQHRAFNPFSEES